MRKFVEFKFHIDAFSPDTIPMQVLAEFLQDLSIVLGEPHAVHFNRLEGGSTSPVIRVESEAHPAVVGRVHQVKSNDAPDDAMRAKRRIEKRLVQYNAQDADLLADDGARILHFPGRGAHREPVYGPVRQPAELIGVVIMMGGKNDPIPVHIRDGARVHTCVAKLDVARKIKPFFLTDEQVRVTGDAKHYRNEQGIWELQEFRISDCQALDGATFGEVLEEMRRVDGQWLDPALQRDLKD